MAEANLTAARLCELLHFESETGCFTWLERRLADFADLRSCAAWNARYAGVEAGSVGINGYVSIRVNNTAYLAHRLAWVLTFGSWPSEEIDHINGVKTDNRIANLRVVSRALNQQNVRSQRKASPTPVGVYFHERKVARAFSASVRVDGKTKHLGYFDTAEIAREAYLSAKRIHQPGCSF